MYSAEVKVMDTSIIDAYAALFEKAPVLVQTIVDREVTPVGEEMLAELRREPGAAKHPIQWTSAKQRRWFWRQVGLGLIDVPYVRSHRMINAWKLRIVMEAGQITLVEATNDVDYRQYVTGSDRQKYHSITGWQSDKDVTDYYAEVMADRAETGVIRAFYAVED